MKVSYNGGKKNTKAFGYDFSDGEVDVPASDALATGKFLGNRFFDCGDPDAVADPTEDDNALKLGVFKLKQDGEPYATPEKIFEGDDRKEQANQWMIDKEKDLDSYVYLER